MPGLLLYTIYALALARITRLAVTDTILETPRTRIQTWLFNRNHKHLWYATTCTWCLGMWIALISAPLIYYQGKTPWMILPATALALSQTTGMITQARNQGEG